MPNALRRLDVDGIVQFSTVRWTGTVTSRPVAVTEIEPS
jgi:hypothetical protein